MTESEKQEIITSKIDGCYKCGHCSLYFKTKKLYLNHESTCLTLQNVKKKVVFASENDLSVPTMRELFNILQDLTIRVNKVVNDVEEIKKCVKFKKPILSINEYLNSEVKLDRSFELWLDDIKLERRHLELIFENGFINGMTLILQEFCIEKYGSKTIDIIPLRAFNEKNNSLYVFEDSWKEMEPNQFEKFINNIHKKCCALFLVWQDEHSKKPYDDKNTFIYNENWLKVMACGISRETLLIKLKNKLYFLIKQKYNQ